MLGFWLTEKIFEGKVVSFLNSFGAQERVPFAGKEVSGHEVYERFRLALDNVFILSSARVNCVAGCSATNG